MNSVILKVNCNHLKREINDDFLGIRNHLYLCVLASVSMIRLAGTPFTRLYVEDSYYQTALDYASNLQSLESIIANLGVVCAPRQFLNIHEYVESFLINTLINEKKHYLSVTIDSAYYMILTIKSI